jgi:endonuclease/exonuclease/phosphatase family metal-dependent hydrolase
MSADRITVATFNVHHGRGRDGRVDLGRSAAVISEMAPDLIALQELDVNMDRSGHVDQPSALGELIGMTVHFFPALTFGGGEYGIGLAARDELRCNFEELPRLGDEERRIVIVARWRDLNVVTTHLARSDDARAGQTKALAAMASDLLGPTIVLGDLNQPARHLGPLEAAGFSVARPSAPLTWWLRPHPKVDHILVGDGLRSRRARLWPTKASDHSALVADVIRARGVRELVDA